MTARFVTVQDAGALARIHADAFAAPWSRSDFAELLGSPGVFGVAKPEGFALVRAIAGEAELLTLAVSPARRRKGLGRSLLRAAVEGARVAGAETMHLEVAADNAAALALYAAEGFSRAGLRRGYYARASGAPEDAVLMQRALNSPAA